MALIRCRARAKQLVDFSGMQFGMSDVDCEQDLHGRGYLRIETKYGDTPLPLGQRITLERVCHYAENAGVKALALVTSHHNRVGEDIVLAQTRVREYFFEGTWHTPKHPMTAREAQHVFLSLLGLARP